MKRSVRSGIAIAGMAGGFWLLGQAVASADDGGGATVAGSGTSVSGDSAGYSAESTATQNSTGGGNDQTVDATNDVTNDAKTAPINAEGGSSTVGVAAGNGNTTVASSGAGDVSAEQNVTTVVWVESAASGATVSGSGNAAAGNGASYSADAAAAQNNTGGSGGSGHNDQTVTASNNVTNTAHTAPINAGGGTSAVLIAAGNENTLLAGSGSHHGGSCNSGDVYTASFSGGGCESMRGDWWKKHHSGDVDATQNIDTSVTVHSSASGATVTDSGNAWAGNGATYSANAAAEQNNESDGHKRGHKDCKEEEYPALRSSGGYECEHPWWFKGGHNDQYVDSSNNVDNEAHTAPINAGGGTSEVEVIAGNGNTLYCTSKTGDVTCSQNITTIINIISQATGATVTCSGNAAAGNAGKIVCHEETKPAEAKPAAEKPAEQPVKTMAPVKSAPVLSSTQPAGELAFTGAETSMWLTLGLLALGAGGVLTLAGRRRETAAA